MIFVDRIGDAIVCEIPARAAALASGVFVYSLNDETDKRKRMSVNVRKYAQQVTLNVHNVRHLVQWKTYSPLFSHSLLRRSDFFFGSIESEIIRMSTSADTAFITVDQLLKHVSPSH